MAKTINEMIAYLNPCKEAVEWLGKRTNIKKAWNECNQANWLLWLSAHFIDRKTVVLSTCDCAETVLKYVPKDEDRPRKAIDTTRLWTEGKASIEEVKQAASAAYAVDVVYATNANGDAIVAAYAADVADVASDAAYAAYTAGVAAYAVSAAYAVDVVAATVYAATNAAGSAADKTTTEHRLQKRKNLKKLASLVRKRITAEMIEESLLKSI